MLAEKIVEFKRRNKKHVQNALDGQHSRKSWGVRGYWRKYKKSGRRVFVKPHTRGSGKYSKKRYTITGNPISNKDHGREKQDI